MARNKMRLGDLLISVGKITKDQLDFALKKQKSTGAKIGEILVTEGFVTERDIIEVLEFQYGVPHIEIENYKINNEATKLINEKLARKHVLIPISIENNNLVVAMADPLNIFAIDDVKIKSGKVVKPVISTKASILNAIERYYGKNSAESAVKEFTSQQSTKNEDIIDDNILSGVNRSPVVRLVNSIIRQAIRLRASDIHIEPFEKYVRIRFRIDGELQEIMKPSKTAHSAIITRIKIMGNMDIAEKRVPQDGRIEIKLDGIEVDLRISVIPTVYGEKVVIRLLDRSSFLKSKQQLGFTDENLEKFDNILKNPNGIVLVTGPTGSGKSTTLYTALNQLNNINKNIITVEEPVEYKLEGINQVQVNIKTGLTFAKGLRSILRQDPDIVMLGEIRDAETASIAVRAAITGHLVLSTMHTNDAPSTVTRLRDMGIEPYIISSSVIAVIAQRLVRKICDECKTEYDITDNKLLDSKRYEHLKTYKGIGCNYCNNTGYKGRIAIHEIMPITSEIRTLINEKASIPEIREVALNEGMKTLRDNCVELVEKGITTVEELNRVLYNVE